MKTFVGAVLKTTAGVALSLAPAAQAQDQQRDAMLEAFEDAQVVQLLTVPFNPPIGVPLTYRSVIEKQRPKGDSRLELEQALTYQKLGEGFLLDLDMIAIIIDGERVDLSDPALIAEIPAPAQPYVMSVEIELDEVGEPIRLRNWETMRAMLQSLPQITLERLDPETREGAEEAIKMIFAPLLSSSAEDAPSLIVQGWPSVLGYGGLELEDGAAYENETQMDGGLFPNSIKAKLEFSLRRNEDGDYRFVQIMTPDSDALLEATLDLLGRIDQTRGGKGMTEKGREELAGASITMRNDTDIVFEAGSGLPLSAVLTKTISANGQMSRGDIITITRVSE